jgi:hypothetical protein
MPEPAAPLDALTAAEPSAPEPESPSFEALNEPVAASLQSGPTGASANPTPEPAPAAAAAPAGALPPLGDEKSDADLVAEFEKMLNG